VRGQEHLDLGWLRKLCGIAVAKGTVAKTIDSERRAAAPSAIVEPPGAAQSNRTLE
jgi:hypothetical protein